MSWEYASALSALVPKRGQLKVMRAALGIDATHEQVRDAANYLSRIMAGRVNSPGVEQLRLIAKGLGYETLSAFFAHLETRHASSTAIPDADPISKETSALEALVSANTRIAESLEEIAAAAAVAAKPRGQTARPRAQKSASHKVRGKTG